MEANDAAMCINEMMGFEPLHSCAEATPEQNEILEDLTERYRETRPPQDLSESPEASLRAMPKSEGERYDIGPPSAAVGTYARERESCHASRPASACGHSVLRGHAWESDLPLP